jgi:hypothetical protein
MSNESKLLLTIINSIIKLIHTEYLIETQTLKMDSIEFVSITFLEYLHVDVDILLPNENSNKKNNLVIRIHNYKYLFPFTQNKSLTLTLTIKLNDYLKNPDKVFSTILSVIRKEIIS